MHKVACGRLCDAEVNISHKPENLKKKFPGIPSHFSWFSTALWDTRWSKIIGWGGCSWSR